MTMLEKGNQTDAQLRQIVVNEYQKEIDFEWNARMALGRSWKDLTNEDQQKYLFEYKRFLCFSWLPKLNYNRKNGVKVEIKDNALSIPNTMDHNITINITAPDSKIYEVILRVREYADGSFKILNVIAEGVDLALSYRVQFESFIESKGSALSLIEDLKNKNLILEKKVDFKVKF